MSWKTRYSVWVQQRPRDEGALYAARCLSCSGLSWLCDGTTNKEAWEICKAHEAAVHAHEPK